MELKAQAYKDYGNAAVMKLVLDAMPKLAAEVAAPLSCVDDIVVVGGGSGMSGKVTDETTKLLAELPVRALATQVRRPGVFRPILCQKMNENISTEIEN